MKVSLIGLLVAFLHCLPLAGQDHYFGGSVRGYQFFSLEDSLLLERRDSEIWLGRLTQESSFGDWFKIEAHGLLTLNSPPFNTTSGLAISGSRKFLPLDWDLTDSQDLAVSLSLDRLNFQLDLGKARVTVGRQAVTWGVSYFWPALDLFAPFNAQQVDRDYKAGVDVVRVNIPLGAFSELEFLTGSLGPAFSEDGTAAGLLRWNIGSADLGFMGGTYHEDTVLGTFLTANVKGSGVRGELSWTDSGDPEDRERNRETFWRGSIGFDRQVTPSLTLVGEFSYNGYGTDDPAEYLLLLTSDRVLRGEVNGLAKLYGGVSTTLLIHPLWTFTSSFLINLNDGSGLLIPNLLWSSSDNSEVIFGGQIGLGAELSEVLVPESEYGLVPVSVFAAFRFYF